MAVRNLDVREEKIIDLLRAFADRPADDKTISEQFDFGGRRIKVHIFLLRPGEVVIRIVNKT